MTFNQKKKKKNLKDLNLVQLYIYIYILRNQLYYINHSFSHMYPTLLLGQNWDLSPLFKQYN